MKVTVIGTGYVGLVSGTCFAEIGHNVTCVDINEQKVEMLKAGQCPIYEPGLTDLLSRNVKARRLHFSSKLESIKDSRAVFLAVQTPTSTYGHANLDYFLAALRDVAQVMEEGTIVVIKSTVPIGTCEIVRKELKKITDKKFYVVNNPEFLKEGSAVEDFMRPDRVVIGHDDQSAADVMAELYAPLLRQGNPIFMMSNLSAEMTKYAANCLLATKISFINDIARLCDLTGADVNEVRKGIGSDKRIGPHFLYPGPGYGGSCFPKDVKALIQTAKDLGMTLRIVQAAQEINEDQKTYVFHKMKSHFEEQLSGKTFAIWGAAFKANTDDVRESPAIDMARELCEAGAKVKIYDPEGLENFMALMEFDDITRGRVEAVNDMYECAQGADALVVMTEWREFAAPDFNLLKARLKQAVIFDGRNLYQSEKVLNEGFKYYAIGKVIPSK